MSASTMLPFTGERLVPGATDCEPTFAAKMYHEHIARYRFAAGLVAGKRVLDIGCGVGYGAALLADSGASEVVAFDISTDTIDHARAQFARPSVEYRIASAEDFDFGTFDVVTCFELIEHVHGQDAVLANIARSLSSEGVAVISTPRPRGDSPRSVFHVHELEFDELRSLLDRHFESTQYWFEVNHLGSRIDIELGSDDAETTLLEPDQLTPANADYFVAVVGAQQLDVSGLRAVNVLGDDAYVANLEHDVGVLRESERRLVSELDARAETLEPVVDALTEANERLQDRLRHVERARDRAVARHAEVERHVQAMTQTISWRVTSPLRAVRSSLTAASVFGRRVSAARERRGTANLVAEAPRRLVRTLRARSAPPDPWSVLPVTAPRELEDVGAGVVDVVFLVGAWEGQSKRYRVGNVADGLRELGFRVLVLDAAEVGLLLEYGIVPRRLVVFRAAFGNRADEMREVFRRVRRRGGQVVGDFDDLVFDPSLIDEIDGFRLLPESSRAEYVQGVVGYREMVLEMDIVLSPTAFLAERLRELGVPSVVVRNSLDSSQLAVANEPAEPNDREASVAIGYFSGTRTHQRDFAEAAFALERVLDDRPETRLTIVGHLDLPDTWDRFGARVEKKPFMPYLSLLRLTRDIDVNIAPLVVGNAFCEAKSELKIFEAGAVGVPTVASATTSYSTAINDGVDGFLAKNPDEWYVKLLALVDSPERRARMGAAARQRALATYGYQAAVEEFIAAVGLKPPRRTRIEPATPGRRVAWLIPGLLIGSGGHRNILRAAYQLEKLEYAVDLYFTEWDRDEAELKPLIHRHFYPLEASATRYVGEIAPCDVLFATHWSTVEHAIGNQSRARDVMYFVQDFEPWFYPMGSDYLLAESTYRKGLYHITTGPWCKQILETRYGAEADFFQFPVDTSVFYPRERSDPRRRLLFFAKPEMPRRCYTLGVRALSVLHRLRPDIEFVFFGSTAVDTGALPFPVRLAGILDLEELAELYSNADVGLAFSPTNPSLVPYEMMSCGLTVVDLQSEFAALNYGGDGDVVLLADLDPEVMAVQIADLLADPEELAARSARGRELVSSFPTEHEMGMIVRDLIEARLNVLDPSGRAQ